MVVGRADGGVGAVMAVVVEDAAVAVVLVLQPANAPRRALELDCTVRRGRQRRGGTSLDYCCCAHDKEHQQRRR